MPLVTKKARLQQRDGRKATIIADGLNIEVRLTAKSDSTIPNGGAACRICTLHSKPPQSGIGVGTDLILSFDPGSEMNGNVIVMTL